MVVSADMWRYADAGAHEASAPSDTLLLVTERAEALKAMDLFSHVSGLGPVGPHPPLCGGGADRGGRPPKGAIQVQERGAMRSGCLPSATTTVG